MLKIKHRGRLSLKQGILLPEGSGGIAEEQMGRMQAMEDKEKDGKTPSCKHGKAKDIINSQ